MAESKLSKIPLARGNTLRLADYDDVSLDGSREERASRLVTALRINRRGFALSSVLVGGETNALDSLLVGTVDAYRIKGPSRNNLT